MVRSVQTLIPPFVATLVWSEEQDRVRAPWRILVPLIPVLLISLGVSLALGDVLPVPAFMFVVQLTTALAALVFVAASTRYLDHGRSIWEYGLEVDRRWVKDVLAGFGIGLLGVTIPFLIGISVGWFEVAAVFDSGTSALWVGLVLIVLAYLCVGFWEELLFRGVFLTNAIEGLRGRFSPRWAVVGGLMVMALSFSVIHINQLELLRHPAYLLTWIVSGIMFGVLYLLSGDLALPIGIHASFNTGYTVLFVRADIAGIGVFPALTRIEPAIQSPLFAYGGVIEASAFLTAGILAVLWLWYSRDSDLGLWIHPAIVISEQETREE